MRREQTKLLDRRTPEYDTEFAAAVLTDASPYPQGYILRSTDQIEYYYVCSY